MSRILKPELKEKILSMPESSYGVNRVKCVLTNGKVFSNVLVAWGEEVIKVGESDEMPFDVNEVADVYNDS